MRECTSYHDLSLSQKLDSLPLSLFKFTNSKLVKTTKLTLLESLKAPFSPFLLYKTFAKKSYDFTEVQKDKTKKNHHEAFEFWCS
ncbi:CLUMA_CG019173, isoform A [Clunio marinus]|uniref:CLUMA_CG019173, isoform A n=1 Tax=Clunio marinus TaxID=568069 RepID=A0A1J1J5Z8_9DIPT|nr:CLUMA_CG019173, isoform A [Clunio marinus]